jgi:predicted lysophospholipase L1 biosynthesis ABC-type transport system permease subunit
MEARTRCAGSTDHTYADLWPSRNWRSVSFFWSQAPLNPMSLVVRGHSDPATLGPAIRQAVQTVDPNQPVFGVETMDERLSNSLAQRRQRAWLLTALAFLSVAVAVIGVYGVMAYSVKRRTHEIGVRIAIGAQRGDVLTMLLAKGWRWLLSVSASARCSLLP